MVLLLRAHVSGAQAPQVLLPPARVSGSSIFWKGGVFCAVAIVAHYALKYLGEAWVQDASGSVCSAERAEWMQSVDLRTLQVAVLAPFAVIMLETRLNRDLFTNNTVIE